MKFLFRLLVFLLPVQLGYHFWPNWSFIFGIRVDYLSPTIFFTDMLLLAIIGLFLFKKLKRKAKPTKKLLLIALTTIIITLLNILFTNTPELAAVKWIKIWELIFLGYIISREKNFYFSSWVAAPLAISTIFVSTIGIIQVILGRAIGGPLYFLGERSFSLITPGIATINFYGKELLRAYSTFSHPNSLAGFLGIALLVCRGKLVKIVGMTCLLLTFSSGAIGALLLVALLLLVKNEKIFKIATLTIFWGAVIFSLLLPIISKEAILKVGAGRESLFKRLSLAETAGRIITKSPVYGVGLNNFIPEAPKYDRSSSNVWSLQPVHNIFLLVFSETGMLGLILFVVIFHLAFSKTLGINKTLVALLLFIVLTGTLDHYWLTLQQNQLLMALSLGLSFRKTTE